MTRATLLGEASPIHRLRLLFNEIQRLVYNRIKLFFPCAISRARMKHVSSSSTDQHRESMPPLGEDFLMRSAQKRSPQNSRLQNIKFPPISLQNGFVECLKQQCPSIEGCYALLEPGDNECCYRCTGKYIYASLLTNSANYPNRANWPARACGRDDAEER
jgi:hypothetical protein